MSRVRVKLLKLAGRAELVLRWQDPVTERWHQESTGTGNQRKGETARARKERELSIEVASEDCLFSEFEDRFKEEWLASLKPGTRITVASAFKQVKTHLRPRRLSDITPSRLMLLETRMREAGLAEATVQGYLGHFANAMSWAASIGLVPKQPKADRRRKKKAKNVKARSRAITEAEFERLLEIVPEVRPHDVENFRDYLRGLWLSGLRLAESVELGWDETAGLRVDLSGERPRLRIWSEAEKGGKDRQLPLTPDFGEFLLAIPEEDRHGRVFNLIGKFRGRPLSVKTIGDLISDMGVKAKILVNRQSEKFATAHDLRRSFGTRWASRVMPAVLKELMRHESIETTMDYYVTQQADDVSQQLWEKWGPPADEEAGSQSAAREGDKAGDKKPSRRRRLKTQPKSQRKPKA